MRALLVLMLGVLGTVLHAQTEARDAKALIAAFPARTDDLPAHVGDAFVAALDRNFHTRRAQGQFSVVTREAARVFYGARTGQGATTPETEMAVIQEFSAGLSDSDILDLVMNLSFFGCDAVGIAAASERFFGHPASALTPGEAAALAMLVVAPHGFLGPDNRARAAKRHAFVLDEMVKTGAITSGIRADATLPPLPACG